MNKMCDVYDLMLKLKNHNRNNKNSEYRITEYFKLEDTYIVKNLNMIIEQSTLIFFDFDELILKNKKGLFAILIETIENINMDNNIVKIEFLNSHNKIIIEFIK